MNGKLAVFVAAGLLGAAVLACGLGAERPTGTPPAVQLMPDLPGYQVVEGTTLQEYIATLSEGAALLAGNPELLFLIEKVDRAAACYQDVGAVNVRVYADEGFPLSAGAIAIADQKRLTDPSTLLRCVGGELMPFSTQALDPCSKRYTLAQQDNTLHIVYVGTTEEICQVFCSNLEGCTVQ
jgi:hypothetical protein